MKKTLIFAFLIFLGSSAFANIELDTNLYGRVFCSKSIDSESNVIEQNFNESVFKQGPGFGKEDAISLFFGQKKTKLDIGAGFLLYFDVYANQSLGSNKFIGNGINAGFGMGPVFRYTFTPKFSLFARPAFILTAHSFTFTDNDDIPLDSFRMTDYSLGADFNIGARSWLLNANGYHLGLAYGADFAYAAGSGYFSTNLHKIYDYTENFITAKVYVGICMNFGDRGIDR